ncbi:protein patched [Aethina tumida]|uniref:protein patched n=1 Tax=Aethina tumida TaxID=116153 RepID=UPI00096B5E08|nr:protein patched [Aethina tumida]
MASMGPSESSPTETADRERHQSDLYTRPGWVDADIALGQLDQGKANGDRGILWVRGRIQRQLHSLGGILDGHAGKFLFVSFLAIATFSVGLKSMTFHSDIELLWAEPSTNPDSSPPEMLSTHQMVVQTGIDEDVNLLHPHGLLEHLALVQRATQVTITMYDITWRLKDLCQSPSIPNIDIYNIETIFEKMMPCSIVTPLDCFWEGSKLLGPPFPVHIPTIPTSDELKWTNLNPMKLLNMLKKKDLQFDYHLLEDYLKRAGITTGFQEKPCLNPQDPECPETAPNFNTTQPMDVGAELTSGCYGFAAKYMHWPEDLIVGGAQKNKSGHIKQAKALQTVVQLMGEHEFYEYWSGHYKVHHAGWNPDKATAVLNAWQKKFAQEVVRLSKSKESSTSYLFHTFSTANLNMILKEHSKTDLIKLGIVLAVVALYSWVAQSGIAVFGVIVLASSATAALGVCSLIGLPMNLLSTQVLPFITVGLAMREMFLILSTQAERNLTPSEVLQRTGPNIISSALINSAAFAAAAILPVPALRVFCLQCGVLIIFHCAALIIVFPSLLALRQRCCKGDVPCFKSEVRTKANHPINNNNDPEHGANLLRGDIDCKKKANIFWLINRYLTLLLLKPFVKVLLCLTYVVLIIFCVFNGSKLEFDVRISTFLPKNTQEYKYLEAQNKYFGFYNFYLVTTELEYPLQQPLLYEYHSSLTNIPHVLKDSNGGLNMNDFWLSNFREFLTDLQEEFDRNRNLSCVTSEKWFPNATEKAVLAFKLLAQTGVVEYPVDKSQILKKRLVKNNIIDPKAFYNYLTVWNSNDQISYTSSQANLIPKPFSFFSSKTEYDLKIPKSHPLVYTQMPFYLKNLKNTQDIVTTLKQIKDISEEFNSKGLKNYPVGLIFAYFNQFLLLDRLLAAQFILTMMAAALVASISIQWTKLLCPLFSALTSLLLMCLVDVNALSGTLGALHFIIISRNILLIMTSFLCAIGSRERRLRMSLEVTTEAIIKGDIGLLVCTAVLVTSHFEFIEQHLFTSIVVSVGGSLLNSLIFFPLLLTILGPKPELEPLEHTDRISTPPPPVLPHQTVITERNSRNSTNSSYSRPTRRTTSHSKATREPSLTTITEESCNQSIVVEPQVTVEYSSPESSSSGQYTTKVTATANIKVELVAPVYRSSKCGKCHRSNKCFTNRRNSNSQRSNPAGVHQRCRCCKQDSTDSSDSSLETDTTEAETCRASS